MPKRGTSAGRAMRALWDRPEKQLRSLDGLRALAVLLVVCHHWSASRYLEALASTPDRTAQLARLQEFPVFFFGWAGVDLFFVLSGYLIGAQLFRELHREGSIHLGRFLLRRGLRIWPLYYASFLVFRMTGSHIEMHWSDLFFLSNYAPGGMLRGWSLSTEEQFYIAAPLLLIGLRRVVPLRRFIWVLVGVEALVLAWRGFLFHGLEPALAPSLERDFTLVYPIHVHVEGLLAGMTLALLRLTRPALFESVPGAASARGLVVLLGAAICAGAFRSVHDGWFSFLALGLLFGGVAYWALVDASWLSAPLRWRVWYPVSRLSYGMYLNHLVVFPGAYPKITALLASFHDGVVFVSLAGAAIVCVLSLGFAALTFFVIERPFLQLRDLIFPPRKPA